MPLPSQISAAQTALAKAGVSDEAMLNTDVVSEIVQFAKANDGIDNYIYSLCITHNLSPTSLNISFPIIFLLVL